MDEATVQRLYNEDHARCLAWFEERTGTTTTMPQPIEYGLFLVTQFKGIYKPKWMPYVLSIRSTPKGPYTDSAVTYNDDGSWSFRYAREENKGRPGNPYSRIGRSKQIWTTAYQLASFTKKKNAPHISCSGSVFPRSTRSPFFSSRATDPEGPVLLTSQTPPAVARSGGRVARADSQMPRSGLLT